MVNFRENKKENEEEVEAINKKQWHKILLIL